MRPPAMQAAALRRSETRLAWTTLVLSAVYIPVETWVSLPDLTHPFFVIDAIAMVLLVWGAVQSLRARPRRAPGVLCAAIAWCGANVWSAAGRRYYFPGAYDNGEGLINAAMPAVVLTVIVLLFFGWSLYLVARAE
jgi:hypothetical protein